MKKYENSSNIFCLIFTVQHIHTLVSCSHTHTHNTTHTHTHTHTHTQPPHTHTHHYIILYIYDNRIVHHNRCFQFILYFIIIHFDNQRSDINKNDIFLQFSTYVSFTKNFLPTTHAINLTSSYQSSCF